MSNKFTIVRVKGDYEKGLTTNVVEVSANYLSNKTVNIELEIQILDNLDVGSVKLSFDTDHSNSRKQHLSGYFEFDCYFDKSPNDDNTYLSALKYLTSMTTSKPTDYTFASDKWMAFCKVFQEWYFKQLLPILKKEAETSWLLFGNQEAA